MKIARWPGIGLMVVSLALLCFGDVAHGRRLDAACSDGDDDGFVAGVACSTGTDCNDADAASFPGAVESCDGFDNDCDGFVDDDPGCRAVCVAPNAATEDRLTETTEIPVGLAFVWSGNGFGLVWHATSTGDERIVFQRLDALGQAAGAEVELDSTTRARGPSIVWSGSEFGVAWWKDVAGVPTIAFARLDAVGERVGETSLVSVPAVPARWPSVVWTGAEYGVAWVVDLGGDSAVQFVRLDRSGVATGDVVPVAATNGGNPTLAWSGDGYAIAWSGADGARFVRVDPAGVVQGTATTVAAGAPLALAWTGVEYGLLWRDPLASERARFTRVGAQGAPLGPGALVIDDLAVTSAHLVWIGAEYGLSWIAGPLGSRAVRFARMIEAGAMPAQVLTVPGATEAQRSTLVWTGERFAAAWIGRDGPFGSDLFFSAVSCECVDLDGDGFDSCVDCEDDNAAVNPQATEIGCDGVDNDCDSETPDVVDLDQDGKTCLADCDDDDPQFPPPEGCAGLDSECDLLPGVEDCDADGLPDACFRFRRFELAWSRTNVSPTMVSAADLDGNGGNDVIVAKGGGIRWYPNNGSGVLGAERFAANDGANSVWPVDLDGDGDLDLVADGASHVIWHENMDGAGDFSEAYAISTVPEVIRRVHPADIDGDGDLDVLFSANETGEFGWYENLGAATFGPRRPVGSGGTAATFVRGVDLDGDGDNDVLTSSINDQTARWFENLDGAGNFGPGRTIESGVSFYAMDVADFDGDGDLDIVGGQFRLGGWVKLYRNLTGDGDFGPGETVAEIDGVTWVHAADIDNDGDVDLLSASLYDGTVELHENLDGNGSYAAPRGIYDSQFGEYSVFAADLDNDGDLDVIADNQDDWNAHWFRNETNDCNGNGVLDSCEADCNGNGIVDECDVRVGNADCDTNGVLDECEVECDGECDEDGDACYSGLDCDPVNGAAWSAPGPARWLRLLRNEGATTLKWQPPTDPGAVAVRYDVLRSALASVLFPVDCMVSDATVLAAEDATLPGPGAVFHYLVRVWNDCPGTPGSLGAASDGTPRVAPRCP